MKFKDRLKESQERINIQAIEYYKLIKFIKRIEEFEKLSGTKTKTSDINQILTFYKFGFSDGQIDRQS